jgi:hypothetical protein
MKIKFYGRNVKLNSNLRINDMERAARFYAGLLMSKRLIENLTVEIRFDKSVWKKSDDALCEIEDWDSRSPRWFKIYIKPSISRIRVLKALAHEFVHVKQYATSELKQYVKSSNVVRWQKKMIDEDKISYWDQPWEIEAFGREIGLYLRYVEYEKNEKNKNPMAKTLSSNLFRKRIVESKIVYNRKKVTKGD